VTGMEIIIDKSK